VRVLHFSDVHIQLPNWRKRKLRSLGLLRTIASAELWRGRGRDFDDALEVLRAIVRDADRLKVDRVICTGDLTQLAMEEEFVLAREALEPIMDRLTCIPGNHDRYPFDDGSVNALYEKYFPPFVQTLQFDELSMFCLDSVGAVCWPIVTRGRIPSGEFGRLQQWLGETRGCKFVLLHHAPLRHNGKPDYPWHALQGAARLLEVCHPATAVLCGHLHERYEIRAQSRMFCAGSSTMRGNEGYWLYEVTAGHIARAEQRRPGEP
jgi:3',5'-cyclic AMP phosphodiesterase CpdA